MRPKRRKAPKMQVKPIPKEKTIPAYTQYVRGFECLCAKDGRCFGKMEAHHLRKGLPPEDKAGMNQKPPDCYTVPLCRFHHDEYHGTGHDTWEERHGLNLLEISKRLWQQWPGRIKWEKNQ